MLGLMYLLFDFPVWHGIISMCRSNILACLIFPVKSYLQMQVCVHSPLSKMLEIRATVPLTEFGPPMWPLEADNVSSMSASPATAVSRILLNLAKFC